MLAGWFEGVIVGEGDDGKLHIQYDDGDAQDLTLGGLPSLLQHLLPAHYLPRHISKPRTWRAMPLVPQCSFPFSQRGVCREGEREREEWEGEGEGVIGKEGERESDRDRDRDPESASDCEQRVTREHPTCSPGQVPVA